MDKSASAVDAWLACGFGHVEVGTLTPRPQPGNPTPRLFRLIEQDAIINRMGFNNPGIEAAVARLEKRGGGGIVGVNIGKNFDTPNERAVDDYLNCLRAAYRGGGLHRGEHLLAEHQGACATCRRRNRCAAWWAR